MECLICSAEEEAATQVWHTYAARLRMRDALHAAQTMISPELSYGQVADHLRDHQFTQPGPQGQKLNRSLALQEALTTFPRYWFYMMLALYRAWTLSEQQLYQMFYLEQAEDSEELREQMRGDLHRLTARSFLYKVWPQKLSQAITFEDQGPYYFLNRQAVPLIERLEGMPAGTMPLSSYITSADLIKEQSMESDTRFMKAVVSLRSQLYGREFTIEDRQLSVHLGIENWYSPVQLYQQMEGDYDFAPSALLGFRFESRDGSISHLLPSWWEYDRGTEEAEEVVADVARYGSYYQSEEYRLRFPALAENSCPGPLIVVCDDTYRREEIRQAMAKSFAGQQVPVFLTDRGSLVATPYSDEILVSIDGSSSALLNTIWNNCAPLREAHAVPGTGSLEAERKPEAESKTHDLSGWGN